ncbi:BA14K family protein [Rhizobium leguminosarum]|uniref:BA14K family protein n=2 Tax=Rhizobium/Agrobacterium group TaxID=227290 RepID=UPI00391844CE
MPPPSDAVPPSEEYSNDYDGRHYAWCARRYRSYSAYDNSFQPSRGTAQAMLFPLRLSRRPFEPAGAVG